MSAKQSAGSIRLGSSWRAVIYPAHQPFGLERGTDSPGDGRSKVLVCTCSEMMPIGQPVHQRFCAVRGFVAPEDARAEAPAYIEYPIGLDACIDASGPENSLFFIPIRHACRQAALRIRLDPAEGRDFPSRNRGEERWICKMVGRPDRRPALQPGHQRSSSERAVITPGDTRDDSSTNHAT